MSMGFLPDALAPAYFPVDFLLDNTQRVPSSELTVGSFVLVPTTPTGPTTAAALAADLQLTVLRLDSSVLGIQEFRRVICFYMDASALASEQNSLASYGPLNRPLFIKPPLVAVVDGAPPPPPVSWIVITAACRAILMETIQEQQAQQGPPPAIPIPQVQPVQLAPLGYDLAHQLGAQQAAQLSASRETTANVLAMARFTSFQHALPPGLFDASMSEFMVGLPPGQSPSAGFFKTDRVLARLHGIFYHMAQGVPELKMSITNEKLSRFVLLDFSSNFSLLDLATPDEKPTTMYTVSAFVHRVLDYVATIYGIPLVTAISMATTTLVSFRALHCSELLATDVLEILERRIHGLPESPLFTGGSDIPLKDRLATYFVFNRQQDDVSRMIDRVHMRRTVPSPRPAKRQDSSGPLPSPKAQRTSPTQPNSKPALADWYAELHSSHPELKDRPLPCFHWLAGKHPCKDHSTCQKKNGKSLHSLSGPAVPAKEAIVSWLAKDPLGRFL